MLSPLLYLWTHAFKYRILFHVAGDPLLNFPILIVFLLTQSEYLFTFPLTSNNHNDDSSNCQNLLRTSGLSFKHFKSAFILWLIASYQHLVVMLHLLCRLLLARYLNDFYNIQMSHQIKLSLFELLFPPHATCCLNLHITNLRTI